MKKSLTLKVAEIIDRTAQFDDYSGSLFDKELGDPELERARNYYLKNADKIIKLVKKEIQK